MRGSQSGPACHMSFVSLQLDSPWRSCSTREHCISAKSRALSSLGVLVTGGTAGQIGLRLGLDTYGLTKFYI